MIEEITPATCPNQGIAQILVIHAWIRHGGTEWAIDGPTVDSIWILHPQVCRHITTVCRNCVDVWSIKHIVLPAGPGAPEPSPDKY